MAKKLHVTWTGIERASFKLASHLQSADIKWRGIIAISRGGFVPATLIAYHLDIKNIKTITSVGYDGEKKLKKVKLTNVPKLPEDGYGWLVIDDISDTGRTLRELRKRIPRATYISLFVKPAGKSMVDIFDKEVTTHCWVDFPWEKKNLYTENNS